MSCFIVIIIDTVIIIITNDCSDDFASYIPHRAKTLEPTSRTWVGRDGAMAPSACKNHQSYTYTDTYYI